MECTITLSLSLSHTHTHTDVELLVHCRWGRGCRLVPGLLLREGYDHLSASPDAVVELEGGGLAVVE